MESQEIINHCKDIIITESLYTLPWTLDLVVNSTEYTLIDNDRRNCIIILPTDVYNNYISCETKYTTIYTYNNTSELETIIDFILSHSDLYIEKHEDALDYVF